MSDAITVADLGRLARWMSTEDYTAAEIAEAMSDPEDYALWIAALREGRTPGED